MLSAWILTLFISTGNGVTSQLYTFKNRDECVKAQQWYAKVYDAHYYVKTSCYPSLVTK